MCGMNLLIHSQTSMLQQLQFGVDESFYLTHWTGYENGWVILLHALCCAYHYLSVLGLQLIRVNKGIWGDKTVLSWTNTVTKITIFSLYVWKTKIHFNGCWHSSLIDHLNLKPTHPNKLVKVQLTSWTQVSKFPSACVFLHSHLNSCYKDDVLQREK